jgi:hypothetical protein
MQVLVVFSDTKHAIALRVSAYTGAVLRKDVLPGPVTHLQAIREGADFEKEYLMSSIVAPFPQDVHAFMYPPAAAVPVDVPLYLWAADPASGVLSSWACGVVYGVHALTWGHARQCDCAFRPDLYRRPPLLRGIHSHSAPAAAAAASKMCG